MERSLFEQNRALQDQLEVQYSAYMVLQRDNARLERELRESKSCVNTLLLMIRDRDDELEKLKNLVAMEEMDLKPVVIAATSEKEEQLGVRVSGGGNIVAIGGTGVKNNGKSALLEAENSSLKNQISGLSGKIRQTDKKLAELEKRLKRKADASERFMKSSSNSRGCSFGNREISETSLTKGSERNCSKKTEFNWENEDDMLNSLVEDQYLCMEAVCVSFRLENSQVELGTKRPQGPKHRGLFGTDVLRASKMAYFLTRGDPSRPVQRTIEELNEFDEFGMQSCHQLIWLYSRHLFEVYKNKEDPYFGYNA